MLWRLKKYAPSFCQWRGAGVWEMICEKVTGKAWLEMAYFMAMNELWR
jgi:hypothetical protein